MNEIQKVMRDVTKENRGELVDLKKLHVEKIEIENVNVTQHTHYHTAEPEPEVEVEQEKSEGQEVVNNMFSGEPKKKSRSLMWRASILLLFATLFIVFFILLDVLPKKHGNMDVIQHWKDSQEKKPITDL